MKLLVLLFSPFSCHFFPLLSAYQTARRYISEPSLQLWELETSCFSLPAGEPLPADQAAGRLLLLRVRAASSTSRPRALLC